MTLITLARPTRTTPLTTHDLARIVRRIAVEPRPWRPLLADRLRQVWLPAPPGVRAWLATWPADAPGADPGDDATVRARARGGASPPDPARVRDGAGAAAFAVVHGTLLETRSDVVLGVWTTTLAAPAVRVVEPGVIHELRNDGTRPAFTIHAQAVA
jgi:hypothetical protein